MPDYKKAEDFIFRRLRKELPKNLYYHGYHHTEDVMQAAMEIAGAEKISPAEKKLLRVAVAFHDAGFIHIYNGHEDIGCQMARDALPAMHFSQEEINKICGMIMATKIPQKPNNLVEQIIADADLDYLGRKDVDTVAATLFEELMHYSNLNNEADWNELQISFLKSHHYFTKYSLKVRAPAKEEYMNRLIKNQDTI